MLQEHEEAVASLSRFLGLALAEQPEAQRVDLMCVLLENAGSMHYLGAEPLCEEAAAEAAQSARAISTLLGSQPPQIFFTPPPPPPLQGGSALPALSAASPAAAVPDLEAALESLTAARPSSTLSSQVEDARVAQVEAYVAAAAAAAALSSPPCQRPPAATTAAHLWLYEALLSKVCRSVE